MKEQMNLLSCRGQQPYIEYICSYLITEINSLADSFNEISTPNRSFNTKIWLISKCLIAITIIFLCTVAFLKISLFVYKHFFI